MSRLTLPFDDLFRRRDDGSFSPRRCIYVGSMAVTPGMRLEAGTPHAGFDVASYTGRRLDVNERPDGSLELHGCCD